MTARKRTAEPPTGGALPGSSRPPSWSEAQAEAHLRSLELFGMRFGLDRMRRLMTVLGSPQRRYDSIHVVGTNGKTSTTRMIAAILERQGMRTSAYTSPHLISYRERLQIGERDLAAERFAAAVARAAWAAERVNRTLAGDDHVTQFELLTAAALWEIGERDVQLAVIEAGLGGRFDATAVIDARVTALTNVALEHTRWLGPTLRDIAEEKLAMLPARTTLVLGARMAPQALAVAERLASERGARILAVPEETPTTPSGRRAPPLSARGAFQQRNFALARLAAERYVHDAGGVRWGIDGSNVGLRERAVREAALASEVRGRLQLVADDPLTVLDGAHNPAAVRALVQSLGEIVGDRPLAIVLGVLEDKDAVGMLAPLLEVCERAWFTAPRSDRALSPATLQSLARQLGFERVACQPRADRALSDAQRWARERGGAVLVTGSVYLVGELLALLDDPDVALQTRAGRRRAAR
ncbi:MAG TPA: cyanophycin synthetase [Solirubrobacteraceae bacterium]|nr:cyanophycin synthetase [Solirubrobacteraceae bacterium]